MHLAVSPINYAKALEIWDENDHPKYQVGYQRSYITLIKNHEPQQAKETRCIYLVAISLSLSQTLRKVI